MLKDFDIVVGIDQTGAKRSRLKAKRLAGVVAKKQKTKWQIQCLELEEVFDTRISKLVSKQPIPIAIDCVLGLPKEVDFHSYQGSQLIFELAYAANRLQDAYQEKGLATYGMEISSRFFRSMLAKNQPLARRQIETLLGANSVFKERPYQKNIQSGTFRILSDLGRYHERQGQWPKIWPFDPYSEQANFYLCECYPSFLWKQDWQLSNRKPELLLNELTRYPLSFANGSIAILEKSVDHCDALVNALAVLRRGKSGFLDKKHLPSSALSLEGWIFGA